MIVTHDYLHWDKALASRSAANSTFFSTGETLRKSTYLNRAQEFEINGVAYAAPRLRIGLQLKVDQ